MDVNLKTILIDFDGVLHSYKSGWRGIDVIPDSPVEGAIQWLRDMRAYGFQLAIYSSRSQSQAGHDAMRAWLREHGVDEDLLNHIIFPSKKPPAWLTIDDRCLLFNGIFPSMEEIDNFKPWYIR